MQTLLPVHVAEAGNSLPLVLNLGSAAAMLLCGLGGGRVSFLLLRKVLSVPNDCTLIVVTGLGSAAALSPSFSGS